MHIYSYLMYLLILTEPGLTILLTLVTRSLWCSNHSHIILGLNAYCQLAVRWYRLVRNAWQAPPRYGSDSSK